MSSTVYVNKVLTRTDIEDISYMSISVKTLNDSVQYKYKFSSKKKYYRILKRSLQKKDF